MLVGLDRTCTLTVGAPNRRALLLLVAGQRLLLVCSFLLGFWDSKQVSWSVLYLSGLRSYIRVRVFSFSLILNMSLNNLIENAPEHLAFLVGVL